jgi:hypothetical protein
VKDFLGSSWVLPRLRRRRIGEGQLTASNVAAQTAAIWTGILNVRQAMRNAGYADSAYTILVQDYEAAIPKGSDFRYSQFSYSRQWTGGCGFWNNDADWANTTALPTINRAVRSAAAQAGLPNVRLLELSRAFDGRQLCSKSVGLLEEQGLADWRAAGAADKTEWVDQIRTATAIGSQFLIRTAPSDSRSLRPGCRDCNPALGWRNLREAGAEIGRDWDLSPPA